MNKCSYPAVQGEKGFDQVTSNKTAGAGDQNIF